MEEKDYYCDDCHWYGDDKFVNDEGEIESWCDRCLFNENNNDD